MKPLKSSACSAGYDQEELYFFRRDQELIQAVRKAHLHLIQGGKSESAESKPEVQAQQSDEELKKAA